MESRKRQKVEPASHRATSCSSVGGGHAADRMGKHVLANRNLHAPGSDDRMHQGSLMKDYIRELEEQAQALQHLLDKHAMPEDMSRAGIPASARGIITYSHKLCYTTFAPPAYQAGVTVLHNFRPPMPQEWELRASQLHTHKGDHDRPRPQEAHAALDSSRDELGTAQTQLPNALQAEQAALPELPPMPTGWKPGDPIPGVDTGAPAEAGASTGKGVDKQPEQYAELPTFELILNPEWEDAEEEFSDEELVE